MGTVQFDRDGNLRMIDVSDKRKSLRTAKASGFIRMSGRTLKMLMAGGLPKGDALTVAKTAGLIACKKTPELIPMCHPISITHCDIRFKLEKKGIRVTSEVRSLDRTGVEMEALTTLSVVLLNIYDMTKAIDKKMDITDIWLVKKTGGKSGNYTRK